ncbi:hypothetical protein AY599_26765 [Leptolyngbya valderiana BDU 20041]|nr:hypothetical protein AY599_26765 [Leptolyngbya valderiana BDU 20041]
MVPANRLEFNPEESDRAPNQIPVWIFHIDDRPNHPPNLRPLWSNAAAERIVLESGGRAGEVLDLARSLWQSAAEVPDGEVAIADGQFEDATSPVSAPYFCAKTSIDRGNPWLVVRAVPPENDEDAVLVSLYRENGELVWQDPSSERYYGDGGEGETSLQARCDDSQTGDYLLERLSRARDRSHYDLVRVRTPRGYRWHEIELHAIASGDTQTAILSLERPFATPSRSLDPLLTGVSEALHSFLTGEATASRRIDIALARLGSAAEVDRLELYADDGHGRFLCQSSWTSDPDGDRVVSLSRHLQPDNTFPITMARLKTSEIVTSDDPTLPEDERVRLLENQTSHVFLIPIVFDGRLWGVASLETSRPVRERPARERQILQTAVTTLGHALARDANSTPRRSEDTYSNLEFLRLLDGVNWANHLLLTRDDDPQQVVGQALHLLGTAAAAVRAYIVEVNLPTAESVRVNCRYEWICESHSLPRADRVWQEFPRTPLFETIYDRLVRGQSSILSPLDLPESLHSPCRSCQSITVVGIELEGKLWGFLGLDCDRQRNWSDTELLILRSAAGSVGGTLARYQARERLDRRDRLLDGVAQATTALLTLNDLELAFARTVAVLGQAADADRAYLFQRHLHPVTDKWVMSQRHEWVAAGTRSYADDPYFQNMPYESTFYDLFETLASNRTICQPVSHMPLLERSALEEQGIQALLLLPVRVEDGLWGFLGFDRCRDDRLWSDGEQTLLRAAAANIGAAVTRQRTKDELARLNAELEHRIWKRTAELQAANRQLTYNAYHDALTGLPNRALLLEQLDASLNQFKRDRNAAFAVLFVDLDRFKIINDSLGHDFGDKLLVETASRLLTCLNHGDLLARLGGDEFAILLREIRHLGDATRIADRVYASLNRPFRIEDRDVYLTVSIGIAPSADRYTKPDEILRDADIVMYHAKTSDGQRYEIFDSAMHNRLLERHQLENHFRRAVSVISSTPPESGAADESQFRVVFQPIVSLSSDRVVGFEALSRWHHPQLGVISPGKFIPLAEESGEIVPLGIWVLYRACRQLQRWQQQFRDFAPLTMSVNLSARQLLDPQLLPQIDRILERTGVSSDRVKLEMTESVVIKNAEFSSRTLAQLRERHIQLSMDDFGTGYSSLSYLHRFQFDTLKIDRSFVNPLKTGRESSSIVQAIIALAHNLKMNTVAEGVETDIQKRILKHLGCEYGQGYLFARPLSAEAATQFLERAYSGGPQPDIDVS